ncbi:uncharacterized protein LOC122249730 [Penaeus japonicus]|uniref:uncharacterized protein LOC122249730 n=1 Tax=Penaeus japonicus TaxID=27405 RepID=UPI001C7158CC|nr:uncharacterized protein LOC122249730 [Penaeus japonicus]
MIDSVTRWSEAVPLQDVTADSVAKVCISMWVSHFGAPDTITTDRGPQYESGLFTHLTCTLGSHRIHTTVYQPQANGVVERLHYQLKALLIRPSGIGWLDQPPHTLLHIRTSFKQDLECMAAELVYGTKLSLPMDFIMPLHGSDDPKVFIRLLRTRMETVQARLPRTIRNSSIYVL